jgi:pimeloyl-ACP methyl ester carboxylesterase
MEHKSPIVFSNRQGHRLFGILHKPAHATSDLAIVLLSPGVKMRVGPECLYLRMTELFVRLGIPVLRFDFYGLGDSEGELKETHLKDVYNHIEVGRFVDDTFDAMDWMQKHHGISRFILSGLCGGAITGLLAASRDPRVAGLLGLGITPLLASRAADPSLYMSSGQLQHLRRGYLRNMLKLSSWLRLLTFKSDYRVLWRSVSTPLKKHLRRKPEAPTAPVPYDDANPIFPPAFFKVLESRRPMLLIFGGSDRLRWDFEEKFLARHRERLAALPQTYHVHVIENANHVLSFEEWQREMLEVSRGWLTQHFGGDCTIAPRSENARPFAAAQPTTSPA